MHLEIHDKTKLKDIQKVFSDYYPYLSISFFKGHHELYENSPIAYEINPEKTIAEIRKTHISTILEIRPWYRVKDVEKEFQERIGISVQILKKEKEAWEQTTGLDQLSLKDLNILGRNSSDEFVVTDYDESFGQEEF
jgi:hypothetical protein